MDESFQPADRKLSEGDSTGELTHRLILYRDYEKRLHFVGEKTLKMASVPIPGGLDPKNQLLSYLQSRRLFVRNCGSHNKELWLRRASRTPSARLVAAEPADRGDRCGRPGSVGMAAATKSLACGPPRYSVALAKNRASNNDANLLTLGLFSGQTNFETPADRRRPFLGRANVLRTASERVQLINPSRSVPIETGAHQSTIAGHDG